MAVKNEQLDPAKRGGWLGYYIAVILIAALGVSAAMIMGNLETEGRQYWCDKELKQPLLLDGKKYGKKYFTEIGQICKGEIVSDPKSSKEYYSVDVETNSNGVKTAKTKPTDVYIVVAIGAVASAPFIAWLIVFAGWEDRFRRGCGQYVAWSVICIEMTVLVDKFFGPMEYGGDALRGGALSEDVILIYGLISAVPLAFLSILIPWKFRQSILRPPSPADLLRLMSGVPPSLADLPPDTNEAPPSRADLRPLTNRALVRRTILEGKNKNAFIIALFSSSAGIDRDSCIGDIVRDDIKNGHKKGAQQRLSWIGNEELRNTFQTAISQLTKPPLSIAEQPVPPRVEISVIVIENFYADGENSNVAVSGFRDAEAAQEYAKCRIRNSVEELREKGDDAEIVRRKWEALGTDVIFDGKRFGANLVEGFAREPSTDSADVNYGALAPIPKDVGAHSAHYGQGSIIVDLGIFVFAALLEGFLKRKPGSIRKGISEITERYRVTMVDNLFRDDARVRYIKSGFQLRIDARAYAVKMVTASIGSFHLKGMKSEELYRLWKAEGIDAIPEELPDDQTGVGVGEKVFAKQYDFKTQKLIVR